MARHPSLPPLRHSLRRSLAIIAALSAFALIASPAQAQFLSVYGTFSPVHVSNVINGGASPNYLSTSFWTPGVGAGVTFGVIPIGPVRIGLDLRGSTKPGTNGTDLLLAGPKVALKLPLIAFKPYLQASGGYLATRIRITTGFPAGSSVTDRFAAYEIMAGVDHHLLPFIDLRLIEVGAGKGYSYSSAGIGGNYTVNLFTINTGVVLNF